MRKIYSSHFKNWLRYPSDSPCSRIKYTLRPSRLGCLANSRTALSITYFCFSLLGLGLLSGCGLFGSGSKAETPLSSELALKESRGSLTGGEGLFGMGGSKDKENTGGGIGVNSFLWRATLDTLAFMPLSSADPFGGVILTDWYEDPKAKGERFKVNALILDRTLRADGIKITLFKQKADMNGNWHDIAVNPQVARELEDTILTRAREMRLAQGSK